MNSTLPDFQIENFSNYNNNLQYDTLLGTPIRGLAIEPLRHQFSRRPLSNPCALLQPSSNRIHTSTSRSKKARPEPTLRPITARKASRGRIGLQLPYFCA